MTPLKSESLTYQSTQRSENIARGKDITVVTVLGCIS